LKSFNKYTIQTTDSAYSSLKCLYGEIFEKLQHESNEVVIFMREPSSMRADGRTDRHDEASQFCECT